MNGEGTGDRGFGARRERPEFEQALVDHVLSTMMAFLTRLEHEQNPPVDLVAVPAQESGGSDEHGDMGVVPTRVHRAIDPRTEIESGVLGHGKRIHVAPQQHGRTGVVAFEGGGDPRGCLVQGDVDRKAFERFENLLARARKMIADLGPLMQGATKIHGLALEVEGFFGECREDGGFGHGSTLEGSDGMIVRMEGTVPTDGVDEFVDIVDEEDCVVGRVSRSTMRAHRLRHRAVFVAVTDGRGRLLVHRRSVAKDVWPGWCDIAVGGVVASGEDYLTAAHRELAEEIGIRADDIAVLDDGHALAFDDDSVSLLGRCFQVVHQGPFEFSDGEVADAWWMDRADLERLLKTESFLPDSVALLLPRIRW